MYTYIHVHVHVYTCTCTCLTSAIIPRTLPGTSRSAAISGIASLYWLRYGIALEY